MCLFTRRDLLGEAVDPIEELWESQEVARLVCWQLPNGAWKYPSPRTELRSADNYNLLETYRALGELVEKHGLHKGHPAIRRASRYILGHQSVDGDIRGIYGTQYLAELHGRVPQAADEGRSCFRSSRAARLPMAAVDPPRRSLPGDPASNGW